MTPNELMLERYFTILKTRGSLGFDRGHKDRSHVS